MSTLTGKRIALLIGDGFASQEVSLASEALLMAGAEIDIVSTRSGPISPEGSSGSIVARALGGAYSRPYAGLLIPGGAQSAEHLRKERSAMVFVDSFVGAGKPIAVIGHGVIILADLGYLDGSIVSAPESLRDRIIAAGASWVDQPATVDHGFISGRSADELTDFNNAMVDAFAACEAGVPV